MINLSINCGLLTTWTKNYDIQVSFLISNTEIQILSFEVRTSNLNRSFSFQKEVVDHNPVEFLQRALDKHNVKCRVEILLNDSTGTLMKGIYLNKDCKLGVILGTGFNMCYCENDCSRLQKWQEERLSKYRDVKNVFIDIECGVGLFCHSSASVSSPVSSSTYLFFSC